MIFYFNTNIRHWVVNITEYLTIQIVYKKTETKTKQNGKEFINRCLKAHSYT